MSDALLDTAVAAIQGRAGFRKPRIGIVAGSGLGPALAALTPSLAMAYRDIPGFPESTVAGHAGQILVGDWGGRAVAALSGRSHGYEGHAPAALRLPLRVLRRLGCEAVILLSSVGSINPEIRPGRLALVSDQIMLAGVNPLTGANADAIGPRFPSMVDAYAPALRMRAKKAAASLGLSLGEGVMLHHPGPSFETPAEIRAYRLLGGDLVGMSMAPETIVARHCGLDVLGIGAVTNMGAGLTRDAPSHAETLSMARAMAEDVARLLGRLLEQWDAPA
ncbi:MAG: purine-nucleoside phosphorylase [Rhodospirillales bacterium]|nr:purine-nucleoside phosphorylase [Rhodospirillales bacterium]